MSCISSAHLSHATDIDMHTCVYACTFPQRLDLVLFLFHCASKLYPQFYIPLFVYSAIAITVFAFLFCKVTEFSLSHASSTSTRRSSAIDSVDERLVERNMILTRLGLQLFLMPFFFVPDRFDFRAMPRFIQHIAPLGCMVNSTPNLIRLFVQH